MKLILRSYVERSPVAIAPNWYFLDPGSPVFLVRPITAVCLMVSEVENPDERKPDDIFMVSASEVETAA